MRTLLQRFWRDRRGVSAVEFALIAPAMIIFYFGLAEMTQALMADRRNAHVAASVGDLVAQASQLSNADITDIFAIAPITVAPMPTTDLKIRVMSVTVNASGQAKVDWCEPYGGMADIADGAVVILPAGLVANNESIVVAESSYIYDSPVDYFIPTTGVTFNEKVYLKPRRSSKVLRIT